MIAFEAEDSEAILEASDSAWGRFIAVRLANCVLNDAREKEKTEVVLERLSGLKYDSASLGVPLGDRSVSLRGTAGGSIEVGTKSW